MVVPILVNRGIVALVSALRKSSEMALAGAQLYRYGSKSVKLKAVVIVEVGKEPVPMVMTDQELETLLARPEVRAGRQKYGAVSAAEAAGRKAAA